MARIDGNRGRVQGVGAALTTPSSTAQPGGLGLDRVGAVFAERRAKHEANTDRITLAESASAYRLEASKHLDARADGFDGTGGPFADHVGAELSELAEAQIAALPSRLQQDARLRLGALRDELTLAAFNIEDARREEATLAGLARAGSAETNAILSDPAHYATALDNLDGLAEAAPAALRAKFLADQRAAYAAAYGEARINADPQGYARELESGALDDALAPQVKARQIDAARNEIRRRQDRARIERERNESRAGAAYRSEAAAIERAVSMGLPVSEERLEALGGVAAQGGADTQGAYAVFADAARSAAALQDMAPAEARRALADIRKRVQARGDVTPVEADAIALIEKTVTGTETRLTQDFAGYLVDRGALAPLDLGALDRGALSARAAEADAASARLGVEAQYFTETERAALGRLDPGGPEMLQIASLVAGHPRAPQMLAEIAPKNPELAHFGGLLAQNGSPAFVEDAVAGAAARRDAGFETAIRKGDATGDGALAVASSVYGAAFALSPQTRRASENAAGLAYDGRAQRSGVTREDFDPDAYGRALQEAAGGVYVREGRREVLYGGVAEIGSRRVHAPSWIRNDRFEGVIRALGEDAIAAAGGPAVTASGAPIDWREIKRGTPVAVREGVYQIALGDPASSPEWAMRPDGGVYTLDLNAIRDRLQARPAADALVPRAF